MSLTLALHNARSGLAAAAFQTSVAADNAANATTPLYARRRVDLGPARPGGVEVLRVQRATEGPLMSGLLTATARMTHAQTVQTGLDGLRDIGFDIDAGQTIAGDVASLRDALFAAAAKPSDPALAQAAVGAAGELAARLNDGAAAVARASQEADHSLADAVAELGALLGRFADLNTEVVRATSLGEPALEAADRRNGVLADIARHVGVRVLERAHGDVALFLEGGTTLFDRTPRAVVYEPAGSGQPGAGTVSVDGVAVTGPDALMPMKSGRIAGLVELRDTIVPALGRQLDEVARSLVVAFADTDPAPAGGLPPRPGLFLWSGDPAMPGAPPVAGIAASLRLSPHVDPAQGGNPFLIRDGGAGDPVAIAYRWNTAGSAAYTARLDALATGLAQPMAFATSAGLGTNMSLPGFAEAGIGAFGARRQRAAEEATGAGLLAERLGAAHSNATGVNIDSEMAALLEIERAYQASARVLATVDELLATLIDAVR